MFIGLDVSTQGCKIIVIDDQKVVYSDDLNYDNDLEQYQTRNGVIESNELGVSESDPQMWVEAVDVLLSRMQQNMSGEQMQLIRGINVSGQQHGLVSLDQNGQLTKKTAKLWNDFSTQEEVKILTDGIGGNQQMLDYVQNIQRTGYTLPKIFRIFRQERDIYDQTECFFLVHNYINFYLTGIKVVEYGDSSGTGYFNIINKQYEPKVLELIDHSLLSKLPPIMDSKSKVGQVRTELKQKYGLSQQCEVVCGCGDNMMSAIGTGNINTNIITISLGTSGTIYRFNDSVQVDYHNKEISLFCDSTNNYLELICISNMANGYNEVIKQYGIDDDEFEQLCQQTQIGNGQKWIVPWWGGERTPDLPNAQPILYGFQISDINHKPTVCRGILEGHILNLYYSYSQYFQQLDNISEIRLTGGLANSSIFRQTIADIFGKTVVHIKSEGAALGAAIHSKWIIDTDQSMDSLQSLINQYIQINEDDKTHPIQNHHQIYSQLITKYCEFVDKVKK